MYSVSSHLYISIFIDKIRKMFSNTFRADTMTEFSFGVRGDIIFYLLVKTFIVSNIFALTADWDYPTECFYFFFCFFSTFYFFK